VMLAAMILVGIVSMAIRFRVAGIGSSDQDT
jgi:hypothetical protein